LRYNLKNISLKHFIFTLIKWADTIIADVIKRNTKNAVKRKSAVKVIIITNIAHHVATNTLITKAVVMAMVMPAVGVMEVVEVVEDMVNMVFTIKILQSLFIHTYV